MIFLEVEARSGRASLARTYLDQSEAGQGQGVNNSEGRGWDLGSIMHQPRHKAVTRLTPPEGGVFRDLRREALAQEDRRRITVARAGYVCFILVR